MASSTRTPESAWDRHRRRAEEHPRLAVKTRRREQARMIERMFLAEPEFAAGTFASELLGKPHSQPLTRAEYAAARREGFKISRRLWERGLTHPDGPRSRREIEADIEQAQDELAALRRRLEGAGASRS